MALKKIFAYVILPNKAADASLVPKGGSVKVSANIKQILNKVYKDADFDAQTRVEFRFDDQRKNEMRSLIMGFLFGKKQKEATSALEIAKRLSYSMDGRSSECLFILTKSEEDAGKMMYVGWVFPKEEALQFKPSSGTNQQIKVLEDVFSRTSGLRKAARYLGVNSDGDFMSGTILDFQNGAKLNSLADYWIENFLQSKLTLDKIVGTTKVAEILESLYNKANTYEKKERIYAAILSLKHRNSNRISGNSLSNELFFGDPELLAQFRKAYPNEEMFRAEFNFDKAVFAAEVKTAVYQLTDGTTVASPIGSSLLVITQTSQNSRHLKLEGEVTSVKVD